mgnify:CR=1 FL=1
MTWLNTNLFPPIPPGHTFSSLWYLQRCSLHNHKLYLFQVSQYFWVKCWCSNFEKLLLIYFELHKNGLDIIITVKVNNSLKWFLCLVQLNQPTQWIIAYYYHYCSCYRSYNVKAGAIRSLCKHSVSHGWERTTTAPQCCTQVISNSDERTQRWGAVYCNHR